ncbi:MAG TPA: sigma-70 family RNA polymerase sigma factor [Acidimicrobiales bacterium]|nr:sigma-70 family RNA polymerase sigma factor [Acidimicrobiales bacterium]
MTSEAGGRHAMGLPPFAAVVRVHGPDVWRFCASQVGVGRADDVFQETMLAALAAYPGLRDPGATRPWLLRIAARKAVDLFRATARAPRPGADPDGGVAPGPEPADDELWRRVDALPTKQRQALALRFVADLTHQEIAVTMETSEAAARRNVFEGLRALRAQLGGRAPSPAAATPDPPGGPDPAPNPGGHR